MLKALLKAGYQTVTCDNPSAGDGAALFGGKFVAGNLGVPDRENASLSLNLGNGHGFSLPGVADTVRSVTGLAVPVGTCLHREADSARLIAGPAEPVDMAGCMISLPRRGILRAGAMAPDTANGSPGSSVRTN